MGNLEIPFLLAHFLPGAKETSFSNSISTPLSLTPHRDLPEGQFSVFLRTFFYTLSTLFSLGNFIHSIIRATERTVTHSNSIISHSDFSSGLLMLVGNHLTSPPGLDPKPKHHPPAPNMFPLYS